MNMLANQPNKHQQSVFIGLDYHKKFIQVCVIDQTGRVLGNRRCRRQSVVEKPLSYYETAGYGRLMTNTKLQ